MLRYLILLAFIVVGLFFQYKYRSSTPQQNSEKEATSAKHTFQPQCKCFYCQLRRAVANVEIAYEESEPLSNFKRTDPENIHQWEQDIELDDELDDDERVSDQ